MAHPPTTADQRLTWLSQEPFSLLSSDARARLETSGRQLRFAEGQQMSGDAAIGAEVLVMLTGEARLLGQREGRPFTLRKLGPGEIVGLAALLRAAACEQVSAATPVVAMAIPDALVLDLLRQESAFRGWCASHIWLAELHALLGLLEDQNATAEPFEPVRWRQRLEELAGEVRLIPEQDGRLEARGGETIYLVSANVPDLPIGSVLRAGEALSLIHI